MTMWKRITQNKILLAALLFLISTISHVSASEWIYTVRPGDNLWDLAEDFLVDMRYWRKLQSLNGVTDPEHMKPGSTLRIPLEWTLIQPARATVKRYSGEVKVNLASTGDQQAVSPNMVLQTGDKITTGKGSSVTLEFADGSVLILREDSELKLEVMESYGDEDVYNTQLQLDRGRTDNRVNPYKKPGSRFEIHTPSASAAVRGTVYRVNATDLTSTSSEVLEGEVSIANDLGQESIAEGYGTVARKDAPPLPPVLLLPAPDLSGVPDLIERLPLRIKLPEVPGAAAYRIQITTDPGFQSLNHDGISTSSIAQLAELADGDYLLRVRGIDNNRLEGHDSLNKFTLNARPEPPFAVTPQPDAAVPPDFRAFSWTENAAISQYHFQVADNPEFNQPVVDTADHKGSALTLDQPLAPGNWFWRVAATSTVEGKGPFGDAQPFRVMKPGPQAEPPAMNEDEITFRWSAGEENDQYQIQVARDDSFETLLIDEKLSLPEFVMPRPDQPGTLYMRTRLIGADGFEGAWSSPQSLVIPDERPLWLMGIVPLLIFLL